MRIQDKGTELEVILLTYDEHAVVDSVCDKLDEIRKVVACYPPCKFRDAVLDFYHAVENLTNHTGVEPDWEEPEYPWSEWEEEE